jgi:hypothetical protein
MLGVRTRIAMWDSASRQARGMTARGQTAPGRRTSRGHRHDSRGVWVGLGLLDERQKAPPRLVGADLAEEQGVLHELAEIVRVCLNYQLDEQATMLT